jgi:aspartyl/asparaginyl beta-hydroxylase (cupin superfamily)
MRTTCFYDSSIFPWTSAFVNAYADVRGEVERQAQAMRPVYDNYIESMAGASAKTHRWLTSTLVFFTIRNSLVISQMPKTSALLDHVPGLVTAVMLRMEGGTHLKAHCGYSPDVLRCHFGIVVPEPEACVLRVEDERRKWAEREWLVFDDYLEHEVWHRGTKSRSILLVDVVRPGRPLDPRDVARDVFSLKPGTRFDDELARIAAPEQWLEWLEMGQFPVET